MQNMPKGWSHYFKVKITPSLVLFSKYIMGLRTCDSMILVNFGQKKKKWGRERSFGTNTAKDKLYNFCI